MSGRPVAWTLSEPYGARAWWPGKDHPSDKPDSARVTVTVPEGLRVGEVVVAEDARSRAPGRGQLVAPGGHEGDVKPEACGVIHRRNHVVEKRLVGTAEVAVDTVSASPGTLVYLVGSREAALALRPSFVPVDAAIVGIVDRVGR